MFATSNSQANLFYTDSPASKRGRKQSAGKLKVFEKPPVSKPKASASNWPFSPPKSSKMSHSLKR
jgi:hypothetical protein